MNKIFQLLDRISANSANARTLLKGWRSLLDDDVVEKQWNYTDTENALAKRDLMIEFVGSQTEALFAAINNDMQEILVELTKLSERVDNVVKDVQRREIYANF